MGQPAKSEPDPEPSIKEKEDRFFARDPRYPNTLAELLEKVKVPKEGETK